ncbi:MAG: LPS export ABC transporter permease LptG [Rhodospirillales bacterium]|nr:LPS export ABC transporter permease LptG [Alphaproteobacteria bacterium]MCB9986759.1 LPS export ABC transporter permease LptG [Rhodospirillales bacterium]USO08470.1 MAG: LPS export ABC transporter permease LptG [Rhodospirillales bacterium]
MKILGTNRLLSRYLTMIFLRMFALMLGGLLAIVYLFDTLELLRRADGRGDVGLGLLMKMGLYKLPEVGQMLLPFAILFAAMASFWWLARRHELTAMRAAGYSAWQFVAPLVTAAMAIGFIHIMLIHPLTARAIQHYQGLEAEYLGQHRKLVTVSQQGLWLREADSGGEVIIHADSVALGDWTLKGVTALFYDEVGDFTRRLDAQSALLQPGRWVFHNATIRETGTPAQFYPAYTLATELTLADIQESFSDPDTISFWQLPAFIHTLKDTGLETAPMEVYYQSLLAQPLLLAAMILLAATVSLRPPRFQRALFMVLTGMTSGFVVFFMSSFLRALGGSHQLPVVLAAWSTGVIVLLGSVTWLLNTEDG